MDRLHQLLDLFGHTNQKRRHYPARLGDGDGNLYPVDSNGSPAANRIWARITLPGGVTTRHVRCRKSMPAYGSEVWVALGLDDIWEVAEEKADAAESYWGDSGTGNVGKHASNHSYYGADPLRIEALQYQPLLTRCHTVPGLSVYVEPYVYPHGIGQAWEGGLIDLTAYVPSGTDEQRFVIVGLDVIDNALIVYPGAINTFTYSSGNLRTVPFSAADVAEILVQDDFIPSAAVRLYGGMTRIELFDIFIDCRNWLEVPARKHNYNATIPPTANDDITQGYRRGSFWFVNGTAAFTNFDSTPGAADWRPFGGTSGSTSGNEFDSVYAQGADYQQILNSSGYYLSRQNTTAAAGVQRISARSRGTLSGKTNVQQNDVIDEVILRGYADDGDRDAYKQTVKIIEPTPSSTAMGAEVSEFISDLGSVSPTEIVRKTATRWTFLKPLQITALNLGAPGLLTLAGDTVTRTQYRHTIAAESGTADDLATINGGSDGDLLLIQADAGDTITVKHNTGNIMLKASVDFSLTAHQKLMLVYDGVLSKWCEV
jgi:hypothetical protein